MTVYKLKFKKKEFSEEFLKELTKMLNPYEKSKIICPINKVDEIKDKLKTEYTQYLLQKLNTTKDLLEESYRLEKFLEDNNINSKEAEETNFGKFNYKNDNVKNEVEHSFTKKEKNISIVKPHMICIRNNNNKERRLRIKITDKIQKNQKHIENKTIDFRVDEDGNEIGRKEIYSFENEDEDFDIIICEILILLKNFYKDDIYIETNRIDVSEFSVKDVDLIWLQAFENVRNKTNREINLMDFYEAEEPKEEKETVTLPF